MSVLFSGNDVVFRDRYVGGSGKRERAGKAAPTQARKTLTVFATSSFLTTNHPRCTVHEHPYTLVVQLMIIIEHASDPLSPCVASVRLIYEAAFPRVSA